jgi:hypothetical protein
MESKKAWILESRRRKAEEEEDEDNEEAVPSSEDPESSDVDRSEDDQVDEPAKDASQGHGETSGRDPTDYGDEDLDEQDYLTLDGPPSKGNRHEANEDDATELLSDVEVPREAGRRSLNRVYSNVSRRSRDSEKHTGLGESQDQIFDVEAVPASHDSTVPTATADSSRSRLRQPSPKSKTRRSGSKLDFNFQEWPAEPLQVAPSLLPSESAFDYERRHWTSKVLPISLEDLDAWNEQRDSDDPVDELEYPTDWAELSEFSVLQIASERWLQRVPTRAALRAGPLRAKSG